MEVLLASGTSVDKVKVVLTEALKRVDFMQVARRFAGTSSIASLAVNPSFLITADPLHQVAIERLALPEFADTVGYYYLKAELHRARHRPRLEAAYLDSARTVLESKVRDSPEEASFHSWLGVVYAYLGRKADAVQEGETAARLLPVSKEAYRGANLMTALALIYAIVGRHSEAMDRLEYLQSIPSQISPGVLRADPRWAPLRGDPRFERLIAGSER